MAKRIALIVSSLSAALVLSVALAWAGYGPQASVAAQDDAADAGSDPAGVISALLAPWESGTAAALAPIVEIEEEVVYIEPAPTPKTIRVTRKASAVTSDESRSVRRASDDNGGRGRGSDDDHDEYEDEYEDEHEDEREDREHEREDREDTRGED